METWEELDSDLYRRLAPVAVPARAEQIATVCCLVPGDERREFTAVDLGCGQGALGYALLTCFPRARLIACDGSESMRSTAAHLLAPFEDRVRIEAFDLADDAWFDFLNGAGCVVSSLALHHMEGKRKRALFREIRTRLAEPAALIIADLIEPQRPEARSLFASAWDRAARQASDELGGGFAEFKAAEWNYFRYPDKDDRPSALADQLAWLDDAGFRDVDCFWLHAGHAIYGGYVGDPPPVEPLSLDRGFAAARAALERLDRLG